MTFAQTLPFCGLAAALCLAPSAAWAQRRDRRPVIQRVTDGNNQPTTRAPQGGVINLVGRNFHKCPKPPEGADPKKAVCTHDELKVTVAGQKAFVVASSFDYVTIIIPNSVRPNKRVRVEVSIARQGSASTTIEVVDYKKWKVGKVEAGTESGALGPTNRQDEETRLLQSFQVLRFEQVPTNAGNTFVVEGIAKGVPDKATVQVELRYDGRTVPNGMRHIAVVGEKFKTTFGPYSKKLLYGNYSLELLFELGKQSKRLQRRWKKRLSDSQIEVYSRIQRRKYTSVGTGPGGVCTKEDRQRQASKVKSHYLVFCKEVLSLRDELYRAVADAGRSFFREGRGINEANYKRWLKQMGFVKDDAEAQQLVDNPKYGKASGYFNARAYLAFAEGTLIPGLTKLHKRHRDFNDQYIAPIDEKADTIGDWLISIILLRFQEWSKELYSRAGLEVPDVIGQVPISPVPAPKLSRKFFDAKRRELLRRVGLGAEVDRETK
ncbi:MAG: hypothetical protein D6731_02715 [Planctomycetota bacterium]|nr:MAG: hypothetical protein D6731_02715 [Planctomycetota bacterium]